MSKSNESADTSMIAQAEKILPGDYPAMLEPKAGDAFLRVMRAPETRAGAQLLIAARAEEIGEAILGYVKSLEETVESDFPALFAHAHEIRGLAAMAGMTAAGTIADGLCKYLDVCSRANIAVDTQVTTLHRNAIALAARSEDGATRTGTKMSEELAALTAHIIQVAQRSKIEQG